MQVHAEQAKIPILAKCILGTSFILAVGIWFFVTDSNGAMLPYNPQPHGEQPSALGAARHRRQQIVERGSAATPPQRPPTAERKPVRQARKGDVFDQMKSREVKEAAGDPNSMFDMSTP